MFEVARGVRPCLFKCLLDQAIDVFDDRQQIRFGFLQVLYLGNQELMAFGKRCVFFQGQRVHASKFFKLFQCLIKCANLLFTNIGPSGDFSIVFCLDI